MISGNNFLLLSLIFLATALNAMNELSKRLEKEDKSCSYEQKRNEFLGIDDGTANITSEEAKEQFFKSYKDSYERQITKRKLHIKRNCLTGA